MSTFTIPTIFTAIDKMTAPIRKMAGGVQGFANKAQSFTDRSERSFRKLTPAISGATKQFLSFASAAAISTAIVGGVMFSVQSLKDYETALASTQAVTGVTDEVFKGFKAEINSVAATTKKSSVEIAQAFELVGSAKPELLASSEGLGAVTKASVILSKASRDDLSTSVENLTGVMNQFGLGAEQAERTINTLSAGAKVGSASISDVGLAMKNFGSVASGANLSLEQSVAMVEVLGKFSVKGAEAGTKLRGSLLKLQQAGVGYASGQFEINDALAEAKSKIDALGTAQKKDAAILKMFGAENISTGKILLNNIVLFEKYTKGVTNTNTANEMATTNSNTLSVKLEEMKAAWVNMITSSDGANSALNTVKNTISFVTDNLSTIVSVGSKILLFFAAWKISILAARASLFAYNVALGVSSALSKTASIAVGANAVALKAYTAVQWLANAALYGFPLVWVVGAFIAVGAAIAALIIYWDDMVKWIKESDSWFAKLIRAALLPIIMLFKAISFAVGWVIEKFSEMVNWIKTSDSGFAKFIRGTLQVMANIFNAIGTAISWVIDLFSSLWDWVKKMASGALEPLMAMVDLFSSATQKELGVDMSGEQKLTKELINPKQSEQEALANTIQTTNANVNMTINDPNNRTNIQTENLPPNVKIGTTVQ